MITPEIIYLIFAVTLIIISIMYKVKKDTTKDFTTYGGFLFTGSQVMSIIITYFFLVGLSSSDYTRSIAWIITLLICSLSTAAMTYMIQELSA